MANNRELLYNTPVYVGFSTRDRLRPPYTVTDYECVKTDLLNVFQTRLGERVMLPEFGSAIHDYLFEPLDEISISAIEDDVIRVLGTDPRVEYISSNIKELDYGLQVEIVLQYVPDYNIDSLFVNFIRDSEEAI